MRPFHLTAVRPVLTGCLAAFLLAGCAHGPSEPASEPGAPAAGDASLLRLRQDASLGRAEASAALAARLLDSYERSGHREDLHEAFYWVTKDLDRPASLRSGIAQRAVQRYCSDAVLQWQALCIAGE